MMDGIMARGRRMAQARVAKLVAALIETAEAELPDRAVERRADGVALSGRGLRFDDRVRGLSMLARGLIR